MDIQFYGANCVSISNKHVRVVVDDNLQELGKKSASKARDLLLYTGPHGLPSAEPLLLVDSPGEYEVGNASIYGIPARAHTEESEKKKDATMYKVILDDVRVLVTGHVYPELSEKQLEDIGIVDVMIVPVGGNGYTLDAVGALKLIKKVEPKIVIPTHYDDKALSYAVPQQTLSDALTSLAMEPADTTEKLRLKSSDVGDMLQLVVVKPA
jgi:hypothetical protein